ncbi:MAG: cytosine permease, partial [Bacillota bacterium]
VWGRKINRGLITIVVGLLGTALSATGILQQFTGFLTLLGVTIPPQDEVVDHHDAGQRRYRPELDESAAAGTIPDRVEVWNPVMLATWVLASYVGYKVSWGIPTLNALIAAGLVYYVGMKVVARLQGRPRPRFREAEA